MIGIVLLLVIGAGFVLEGMEDNTKQIEDEACIEAGYRFSLYIDHSYFCVDQDNEWIPVEMISIDNPDSFFFKKLKAIKK